MSKMRGYYVRFELFDKDAKSDYFLINCSSHANHQGPLFANRANAGPRSSSCFFKCVLAFLFCSILKASILSRCSSMIFLFPFFLRCFLKLLFFPLPLFFNASTGSSGFLSRSASFFLSAADARSRFPTKSGFREIISGWSLFRSALTSDSWRCLVFSYGLISRASKFGSPAPGTITLENPWSCDIPRTLLVFLGSALQDMYICQ